MSMSVDNPIQSVARLGNSIHWYEYTDKDAGGRGLIVAIENSISLDWEAKETDLLVPWPATANDLKNAIESAAAYGRKLHENEARKMFPNLAGKYT